MNNVNLNKDVMGLLKTKGKPTQPAQIEKAKEYVYLCVNGQIILYYMVLEVI